MEPTDTVKLLYQNEFGVGHIIPAPEAFRERLMAEIAAVEVRPGIPLCEDIGNGLIRVMLNAPDFSRADPEKLAEACLRTAEGHHGSMVSFEKKLRELETLTAEGIFAFSGTELDAYLSGYRAAGCPPVSHSETYRKAYSPAYRVILSVFYPGLTRIQVK